jgi:cation:H+ antiporter
MPFVWNFGVVLVGLLCLWFLGDRVVEYSLKVSNAFGVTTFFVGFFILAIAADLPEIAIAISSALKGIGEVSVGDLVGANFCDVTFVTGITVLVGGSIKIGTRERKRLFLLLICTTIIMATVFILGELNRIHGIVLIALYLVLITFLWRNRKDCHVQEKEISDFFQSNQYASSLPRWGLLLILFGLLGLILLVTTFLLTYIENLAVLCGAPLEKIGATIVAIGTSLPELSLSLNALKRKEYALVLGPTLGTVLEQCTLVLGLLSVVSSRPVSLVSMRQTSIFMFLGFIIVAYSLMKKTIDRKIGVILLSLFVLYLLFNIFIF